MLSRKAIFDTKRDLVFTNLLNLNIFTQIKFSDNMRIAYQRYVLVRCAQSVPKSVFGTHCTLHTKLIIQNLYIYLTYFGTLRTKR